MTKKNESKTIGGQARAESLTALERKNIASAAARARWGTAVLKAEFGSPERPLRIGDIEIPCYVLEDGSRVLARAAVVKAIGRTGKVKGGRQYDDELQTPVFLGADNLKPFVSSDIEENYKCIEFRHNNLMMIGYRAEFLPQICEVYIDALDAGVLRPNQLHIAKACKALQRSFAKVGIIGLVDEVTGYQNFRARDALQVYLNTFLRQELAAWVKTFPDEFFEHIYRLRKWTMGKSSQRTPLVGKCINDLVYDRLGPQILDELNKRNPMNEKGRRSAKHFQWLTEDIGHPALAQHLYATIGFMRAHDNWHSFIDQFSKAFPKKGDQLALAMSSK